MTDAPQQNLSTHQIAHSHATSPTECDPECGLVPPHGTGQRPDPTLAQDLSLFVQFRRSETFNDELQLGGTHTDATVSWRPVPTHWDPVVKDMVAPHDDRPFDRLEHALRIACNGRKAITEDEPAAVDIDRKRNSIHLSSDSMGLQDLHGIVGGIARQWRMGLLAIPTVSVEEHRTMVTYGIKHRKDGLFGYNLRCTREGCEKKCNTCYAALTILEAVEDMKERRSIYPCSRECFILENGVEELQPDFFHDLARADFSGYVKPELGSRLRRALGMKDDDGLDETDGLTDKLLALRESDPSLWADFMVEVDEWDLDSGDYFCEDGGSVACEV